MVEEQISVDETLRRKVAKSGRPLLSDGRSMSDDDLLSKLHSLQFDIDRIRLLKMIPRFASAQDLSEVLFLKNTSDIPMLKEDWVWIALTCLWERWCPEVPNFEMVDDKMQAGYAELNAGNLELACQLWITTWHDILKIMARHEISTLDAFDEQFAGTQSIYNWVQDFEMELGNAEFDNAYFSHERISFCNTIIDRFSNGSLSEDNFKTALANSYFLIGEQGKCDQIFQKWIDENPESGWGWIGWSDVYSCIAAVEKRDVARAEMILKQGLTRANVSERQLLLERLSQLYEETDRRDDAAAVRREIQQDLATKTVTNDKKLQPNQVGNVAVLKAVNGKLQNNKSRTGRNDPCPCGSGKKFK